MHNNNNNNVDKVNADVVVWVVTAQRVRVDDAGHPLVYRATILKRNIKKVVL
jgi:hypothetical protein